MPFEWLKFLHVITIVASIVLAEGPSLSLLLAARKRDVRWIRRSMELAETGERIARPLLVVSVAAGFAAALIGAIDLTASWLVVSYALLVVVFALGALAGDRHAARIRAAAAASAIEAPSNELISALDSRWSGIVLGMPPLLVSAIILLMVVKPTLW